MRRLVLTLIILASVTGCKHTQSVSKTEKETFEIVITFDTEEAVKQVPYNHSTIKLRLKNALEEHGQYAATITVFPDQFDQIIEKLGTQDGVAEVRLVDSNLDP